MAILTGVFAPHKKAENLENSLKKSGFSESSFIVYIDQESSDVEMASVQINNNMEAENAEQILIKNGATNTYFFDNMNIVDALSYDDIKKNIEIRAKSEIREAPSINAWDADTTGMNSAEATFEE